MNTPIITITTEMIDDLDTYRIMADGQPMPGESFLTFYDCCKRVVKIIEQQAAASEGSFKIQDLISAEKANHYSRNADKKGLNVLEAINQKITLDSQNGKNSSLSVVSAEIANHISKVLARNGFNVFVAHSYSDSLMLQISWAHARSAPA